ncbi:unnamed protein product [Camellia sinensis]
MAAALFLFFVLLMVCGSCHGSHKWSNPEDPMLNPDLWIVVDNSSTKAHAVEGPCDASGAVDEDEDHAAEGPCDAEDSDAVAWSGLLLVTDDCGDSDVEEEECG